MSTGSGDRKSMSVLGAVVLGVGSMVGAGIFALLGQAGAIAGTAVWFSFVIAGFIALLLGYTASKLGIRYRSSGGLVAYLMEAFGRGRLFGTASWLFYFAGMIITAMVAVSFGSYGASLFFGDDAAGWWVNVLATLVVVAMVVVNAAGASTVAKAQSAIVAILLAVFAVFIVVTLIDADWDMLAFSSWPSGSDIIASVALTFFAYLGFAVVTFTVDALRDPARDLPRATYIAILVSAGVYVLVSLGTFGALTPAEVIEYGDTALAKAAEPSLGDAGFTMMALAALLATSSSVNANLFAAFSVTTSLAEDRQFPPVFLRTTRFGAPAGLVISGVIVLALANLFDLSAIADVGSAVAMVIFMLLAIAGLRLRHETRSSVVVLALALVLTTIVLILFAIDTLENDPATFVAMVVVALAALVADRAWTAARDKPEPPPEIPQPVTWV